MPKDVWLLDAIPVTAVGKTFKPALRLDAIRRVFEDETRHLAPAPRIEVVADDRLGQKARLFVGALSLDSRAALAERLGGYAVHVEWLES